MGKTAYSTQGNAESLTEKEIAMVPKCHPSTSGAEGGGLQGNQGHPGLHSELKARLHCKVRSCLKKINKQTNKKKVMALKS